MQCNSNQPIKHFLVYLLGVASGEIPWWSLGEFEAENHFLISLSAKMLLMEAEFRTDWLRYLQHNLHKGPTFDKAFRLPPPEILCDAELCDLLCYLGLIVRHFVPIPGAAYSVEGFGVTGDGEPLVHCWSSEKAKTPRQTWCGQSFEPGYDTWSSGWAMVMQNLHMKGISEPNRWRIIDKDWMRLPASRWRFGFPNIVDARPPCRLEYRFSLKMMLNQASSAILMRRIIADGEPCW